LNLFKARTAKAIRAFVLKISSETIDASAVE